MSTSDHHALEIHAGPVALRHIREHGLAGSDIRLVPAAAGGPKGLILNALDRYIFGQLLAGPGPSVHLVGASIGAWRMATACLPDAEAALARLGIDYIEQRYEHAPGKLPEPVQTSLAFGARLVEHFGGREAEILSHPRFRLHVLASRGRRLLQHVGARHQRPERRSALVLGFAAAYAANSVSRRALGGWLERVVFSDPREPLPLLLDDYATREVALSSANLQPAVLASCSIPFVLRAVRDIPGAPDGAYWDGGLTDYHLHWPYAGLNGRPANADASPLDMPASATLTPGHVQATSCANRAALVLYPHFQPRLVPGWLDKKHTRRHEHTPGLDNLVLLCPSRRWIASLPGGKLPDRDDFHRLIDDDDARIALWRRGLAESQRLADEFAEWLVQGAPVDRVQPLVA
ncbi:MAG: phospholipase [Leptothrix sp. (in: b-proteobacteria)]